MLTIVRLLCCRGSQPLPVFSPADMSREEKCVVLDGTLNVFCQSTIDFVLKGFSTKKTSQDAITAYGHHQDLRMAGEASFWKLRVYPLTVKEEGDLETNFLSCYLALESFLDVQAKCTYAFEIRSPNGDSLMKSVSITHVHGKRNGGEIQARGCTYAFSHENIERNMLFDDNLHIHVDIQYKIISGGLAVKHSSPSAILLNLLQKDGSHESGDILLVSSDSKEFRAHKFILSLHSTVFAAMFKHPFKESITGRCVIEDLDGETISAMISYMYGRDKWNPRLAERLVVAANKYKLDPLENACVQELMKQMNVENVLRFLSIADEHSLERLQNKSLDFIAANMASICASGGLMELRESGSVAILEKIQDRLNSQGKQQGRSKW